MSEQKKSKRRGLTFYLIIAACILVIAAITVTVIFTVNGNSQNFTIDNSQDGEQNEANGGNNGDNSGNGGNDDKPAGGEQGGEQGGNNGNGNDDKPTGGEQGGSSVDTSSKYEFIYPVAGVDMINGYTFYHNKTLGNYYFHTGIDFAAEQGSDVHACLDGEIAEITTGDLLDGTTVKLRHENGVSTLYRFINAKENLKVGDKVKRGDTIGTISEPTGCEYKDGSHLHFEVYKNNVLADPEEYLASAEK